MRRIITHLVGQCRALKYFWNLLNFLVLQVGHSSTHILSHFQTSPDFCFLSGKNYWIHLCFAQVRLSVAQFDVSFFKFAVGYQVSCFAYVLQCATFQIIFEITLGFFFAHIYHVCVSIQYYNRNCNITVIFKSCCLLPSSSRILCFYVSLRELAVFRSAKLSITHCLMSSLVRRKAFNFSSSLPSTSEGSSNPW